MRNKIVFYQRKRRDSQNYSLEQIFEDVRSRLNKEKYEGILKVSSFISKGILPRLFAAIEAIFYQGDINHVTGDIHFVNLFLKKRKTILTILDIRFVERTVGLRRKLIKLFWLDIPIKRAKIVTVISHATKEEILKYVNTNKNKIIVIPVAISERFKYTPKGFNTQKPVLLQIGTAENKNIPRLIEALKDIECRLDIVGKLNADYKKQLIMNNIDYTNSFNLTNEEIVEKYKTCDIVTFVSTYEGFGMPIIEANVIGRPVITGNLLSMPEVAGNAACLVDPYNIDEIKEGLIKIIKNQEYREELIKNGIENAKRYSPESIAQMYMDVYDTIIK